MPQVCVGLQLPGKTRLMVNVCERVAKFSFSMPYWNPNDSRSYRAGFQSIVVANEYRVVCLPLSRHENVVRYGLSGVVSGNHVPVPVGLAVADWLVAVAAPRHCMAVL